MKRNRQAGQALVLASFGLTVFMLAAGLAIDMGYLRYQKRRMQTAADSAAIAGAAELTYGDMNSAAVSDAGNNGFINGTLPDGSQNIQVYCLATITSAATPCPSGTPSLSTPFVEVTISQQEPLFFMHIIPGISLPIVSTKAIAELGSGPGCIYALGNGDVTYYALAAGGGFSPALNASGCSVFDNGSLSLGASDSPSHALTATFFGLSGTCVGASCDSAGLSPYPPQTIVPSLDPLGYLSAPSNPTAVPCPGVITSGSVSPGTYSCPLQIVTSPSTTVTFQPGTYVLQNGLSISGTCSTQCGTVTGTGVTFYNTSGPISINSGATYSNCPAGFYTVGSTVQLLAPADTGILFFQDKGDSQAATITLNNGDGCNTFGLAPASYLWGALYFPKAELDLTGIGLDADSPAACSTLPRFTTVVAQTLTFTGDVNLQAGDCATGNVTPPALPPNPIKAAVLVE